MMNGEIPLKTLKISAGIALAVVLAAALLNVVNIIFIRPAVTYGEFPFRLVYELNGERTVIEDTIICEYDGLGADEGQGIFRRWKAWFLSSGDEKGRYGVILSQDNDKTIYMDVGSASFYMGDWKGLIYENSEVKKIDIDISISPWNALPDAHTDEDILEQCNIKIIEWTHAPPIQNHFYW
jgi:hypothetical protein